MLRVVVAKKPDGVGLFSGKHAWEFLSQTHKNLGSTMRHV
jgi:hypothetical protein